MRPTYFMSPTADPRLAVTIAEAADTLVVSKPRIHQLLREGVLTGPYCGVGRAPAGAKRVWADSLRAVAESRVPAEEGTTPAPVRVRDARVGVPARARAPRR